MYKRTLRIVFGLCYFQDRVKDQAVENKKNNKWSGLDCGKTKSKNNKNKLIDFSFCT